MTAAIWVNLKTLLWYQWTTGRNWTGDTELTENKCEHLLYMTGIFLHVYCFLRGSCVCSYPQWAVGAHPSIHPSTKVVSTRNFRVFFKALWRELLSTPGQMRHTVLFFQYLMEHQWKCSKGRPQNTFWSFAQDLMTLSRGSEVLASSHTSLKLTN